MTCCPTCGQTLPEKPVLGGTHLTPYQKRLFEIITRAGACGIGSDDLFDMLYTGADGGPLTGRKSMYSILNALNKKLARHGLHVQAHANGRRAPWNYMLERILS